VIHSQLCVANVGSRLAARAVRRPHITTVQTTPGPLMEDSRARALADAGTSRLSRILVAVSPSVADAYARYARVSPRRFRVVPNTPAAERPADFDRDAMRARLAPGATHIVATIARLQVEKGIDELIEATALLAPRAPAVHVVVAGGGPEEERLRAAVADRGVGDHITLLGHTPDVSAVLAASDVFCLPSRNEGLPLSLLEAMMFGLPSVATTVGGIPGLLTDGESGLLVPPRDPRALADALERLVTDADLAGRIAAEGTRVVDAQYSPAAVARSYSSLYREVAAR
jgi:glycosyltransferase involved in cell wall biosynthesis